MAYEKFTLINECYAADSIKVKKFQSRTGLVLILVNIPGPLVHGCFIVATEAENDDGLPHTLEHLIFLGSKDYPYKGSLDIIANLCLASGTNAWTEIDHTAYTISTAGSEGFLSVLPVYLDHIFFPSLTDAGFVTEVYHLTDEGKDSGVVFCEMQGCETTGESRTITELMRALYPGKCGYRYNTGGIVNNLRHSTSMEKIRKFHKQFYCPQNTTLLITGVVNEEDVLEILYQFEEKLIQESEPGLFQQAWQSPVPVLQKTSVRAVTYPSDCEDNGVVLVGWQGPSVVNEYYQVIASAILFRYLAETGASPLMEYFVETSEPSCNNISVTVVENSTTAIYFTFENAVIKKMPLISNKLIDLLRIIAENKSKNFKISKDRMNSVIRRFALKQKLAFEKKPEREIAFSLIGDILYGKTYSDMFDRLNHQEVANRLVAEPVSFWNNILKKYFIERPFVTVLGYPSIKEDILRTYFENERINNHHKNLGAEGLKHKAEILQKSVEENKELPPDDLIASIHIPNSNDFNFRSLHYYTSASENQHPDFNIKSPPLFVELDDVESKFVYLYVVMDSRKLPKNLRLYLPLFLEYILECPINRNGQLISCEEVSQELENDLVTFKSSVGIMSDSRFSCGSFSYATTLYLEFIPENFDKGVNWVHELLFNSVFIEDRLKVIVQKLINSLSQIRRQGNNIIQHLTKIMLFDPDSNFRICTALAQLKFLTELNDQLQKEESCEKIIQDLKMVKETLTDTANITLHISTDVRYLANKFKNPEKYLSSLVSKNLVSCKSRVQIPQDKELLSVPIGSKFKSCVVGMATVDSGFLHHSTFSINDHNHPDLPALLVSIEYIIQLEGPMWREIRGFGLAYGYNITLKPDEGILCLTFYRANDLVQAFKKTMNIFKEYGSTAGDWNAFHFESAKNSLIFKIAEHEKNFELISTESLCSYLKNTSHDYHKSLIKKVKSVKQEAMKNIWKTYLTSLFNPQSSLSSIICHNSKCKEVADGFLQFGYELLQFPTIEDSYLNPSFSM